MGTWGTALFASDLSGDIRGCVRPLLRTAVDGDDIADLVADAFPLDEDERAELWFVLAVTLHRAGISAPRAVQRANVDADLGAWERRGASAEDLRARGKVLVAARAELEGPLPARRGRMLDRPERLALAPGDVVAFAPAAFAPANVGYDKRRWPGDRQVAVITLSARHALGELGIYAHAVIDLPPGAPTLAAARGAPLLHATMPGVIGPVLSLTWASPWPKGKIVPLGRLTLRGVLPGWIDLRAIHGRLDHGRSLRDLAVTLLWLDVVGDTRSVVGDLIED